jgi:hypothetical protein
MKYGPKKDRSPHTRLERALHRQELKQTRLNGTGRYVFQNNTPGDLGLPKPAEDGRTAVPPKSRSANDSKFIGDSYFLAMVPQTLILVEDLNVKQTDKLLTEVPPTVTSSGKVEYVLEKKDQKLNESKPGKQPDTLLTEDPAGGIVVFD